MIASIVLVFVFTALLLLPFNNTSNTVKSFKLGAPKLDKKYVIIEPETNCIASNVFDANGVVELLGKNHNISLTYLTPQDQRPIFTLDNMVIDVMWRELSNTPTREFSDKNSRIYGGFFTFGLNRFMIIDYEYWSINYNKYNICKN